KVLLFFFSSRRRHTISKRDWSSDVCSSDLDEASKTVNRGRSMTAIRWQPIPKSGDACMKRQAADMRKVSIRVLHGRPSMMAWTHTAIWSASLRTAGMQIPSSFQRQKVQGRHISHQMQKRL